mgnify:CR=1 FL=1
MTQPQAFLSLRKLEKIYPNGEKAVYDFNLDIEKNEFIVIVGPSGCGKSTTLRMLAGLEDISSGDIFMEGELLNYKACKDRRMAIVFQSYALYPQMNVYDNIAFPLTINKYPSPVIDKVLLACAELRALFSSAAFAQIAEVLSRREKKGEKEESVCDVFGISSGAAKRLLKLYGAEKNFSDADGEKILGRWKAQITEEEERERARVAEKGIRLNEKFCELDEQGREKTELRKLTPHEIRVKVYETAEKLDLTPYLDKLPKELSGGQMQRVALGRAIVKNVPVFLMDEPLSNLDARLRLSMRSEIVKLHNRINATTIYVTHDQTEAMTMATRIVVMSKGFVQQIGTPEEIYNKPVNVFVAKFIGSPAMNLFGMTFDRKGSCLCHGDFSIPVDGAFIAAHDAFYARKTQEFADMCASFGEEAEEKILKLLSVTGEYADRNTRTKEKKSIWQSLKRSKKPVKVGEERFEQTVCRQKRDVLRDLPDAHELTVGIRPERLKIELYDSEKTYENGLIVTPTVSELLGGEYGIHFDFCGRDMVGQIGVEKRITTKDKLVVCFSFEDIYVFDPITGERIQG